MQQRGRSGEEGGGQQDKQQQREHADKDLYAFAQFAAHYLRQRRTALSDGHHAAQVVVHAAGEDSTEHNPQKRRRTEEDAHDSAEDRSETCDIKKLHEENPP